MGLQSIQQWFLSERDKALSAAERGDAIARSRYDALTEAEALLLIRGAGQKQWYYKRPAEPKLEPAQQ